MFSSLFMLRLFFFAAFFWLFDIAPRFLFAHHCPGEPERPARPNHSCRTRTQTWQPGEATDSHPGGAKGRGGQPPEGARDIRRSDSPSASPTTTNTPTPDALTLINTIDQCLREESRIVYYSTPARREYLGRADYSNSNILYDPAYLGRQPPYMRALWLADAFATHVLSLQAQRYPVEDEAPDYRTRARDRIVGFLVGCLNRRNLLPNESEAWTEPERWFRDYRGTGPRSQSQRTDDFMYAWWGARYGLGIGLPRPITMQP